MTTSSNDARAARLERMPIVLAPDAILDLMIDGAGPARRHAAVALFEAIAADVESGKDERPVYIASITVPIIFHHARRSGPGGFGLARDVIRDLLCLCRVADLRNEDYLKALQFRKYELEDALQFVTCRKVNARFLVTRRRFGGVKRAPVFRRTAGEMLALFRRHATMSVV